MVPEALPPYRHISSTPIPSSAASAFIDTYITHSESHPHLHPDALITPSGVTFSSHAGPTGGVVIHNLRRVAAGLRGEYLEAEATPEPEERESRGAGKQSEEIGVEDVVAENAAEGWQDLEEYEREQGGVEVGEVGERVAFVTGGGEAPAVEGMGKIGGDEVANKRKAREDKEARKRAKKERNREFKRLKEKSKQQGGD